MNVDIVLPAHNEEGRIGPTLERYRTAFAERDVRFHVALDGCRDRTAQIVEQHIAHDPRVAVHDFPKLGKGGVLIEAFRRTEGEFVAFVDADGATPPYELRRLLLAAEHADGAIACRRHPAAVTPGARPLARRLASAGFAATVRTVFHLPYLDTQCGAKVLRRSAVDRVVPLLSSRDFTFDVDLLLTARRCGFRIIEVPTVWVDQRDSKVDVVSDSRRMLASVLRLWVHHHLVPIDLVPIGADGQLGRGLSGGTNQGGPSVGPAHAA